MSAISQVKPLRIVAKLKNNRLIRAREAAGYETTRDAERAMGRDRTVSVLAEHCCQRKESKS
jgi:hypothetical protein